MQAFIVNKPPGSLGGKARGYDCITYIYFKGSQGFTVAVIIL